MPNDNLPARLINCYCQISLWSSWTPKNWTESEFLSEFILKLKSISSVLKIKVSRLALYQSDTFSCISSKVCSSSSRSLPSFNTVPNNSKSVTVLQNARSFTYMMDSKGSKTDHWGTPNSIDLMSDCWQLRLTSWYLLVRYEFNNFT